MSNAGTFYHDMATLVERVAVEEKKKYLAPCGGHLQYWPSRVARSAGVIGTKKTRTVYHHNLPLVVVEGSEDIDYSLNATMSKEGIPIEARTFATPLQHASNMASVPRSKFSFDLCTSCP